MISPEERSQAGHGINESCPMALISPICFAAPPATLITSCAAKSRPTSQCGRRPIDGEARRNEPSRQSTETR
jgi:hypothetical protein